MPITKRELQKSLSQKFGFQETPGSRHEALSLIIDGRKVATVRFSRSHRDLSDRVLNLIARESWVNLAYLKQMVGCTKSRAHYLTRLKEQGYLD
jgi:hypothetical protein